MMFTALTIKNHYSTTAILLSVKLVNAFNMCKPKCLSPGKSIFLSSSEKEHSHKSDAGVVDQGQIIWKIQSDLRADLANIFREQKSLILQYLVRLTEI